MTIGSVVFLACCVLSSARMVIDAPRPGSSPGEIAKRSDQRFSVLRAALPARGVVGYVGDLGPPALGDYYLTQYALAPLVVDHSLNHSLVIGNFPNESMPAQPSGLHLINDFGAGVLLYSSNLVAEQDQR
jgi:hypothetical protein